MIEGFMRELTKELEIDFSLKTDIPGIYRLPLDSGLIIHISEIPRGFALSATIADAPNENEETFYENTMHANLFGEGTEGNILGLDESGKLLTLSREVYEQIDYRQFSEIIEDFINALDYWSAEARKLTHPLDEQASEKQADEEKADSESS